MPPHQQTTTGAAAQAAEIPPGICNHEPHRAANSKTQSAKRKIILVDTPTAPEDLLAELARHLPFSIPVLRRIQFAAKFPGVPGSTASTHLLWAFYDDEDEPRCVSLTNQQQNGVVDGKTKQGDGQHEQLQERIGRGNHFAAAYLDLSRYPETQCWIYCTLEDFFSDLNGTVPIGSVYGEGRVSRPREEEQCRGDELVLAILRRVREISILEHTSSADSGKVSGPGSGTGTENGLRLEMASAPPKQVGEAGGQGRGSHTQQEQQEQQTNSQKQEVSNRQGGLDYNGAKHTVLIGSLHETIRQRLLKLGVKMSKTKNIPPEIDWEFCNKWLFRVEDFPAFSGITRKIPAIPGGDDDGEIISLAWNNPDDNSKDRKNSAMETTKPEILKLKFDKVKSEDILLIRSRTSIDRKPETLLRLPSLVLRRVLPSSSSTTASSSSAPWSPNHQNAGIIEENSPKENSQTANEQEENEQSEKESENKKKKEEEEPIAWAFTGLDGTLMTLHVEPLYRGHGLAKLIACKIMRQSLPLYGGDGWGAADVFVANTQSQGVCRSIGGQKAWTLSWAVVDLDSVPLPTTLPTKTSTSIFSV